MTRQQSSGGASADGQGRSQRGAPDFADAASAHQSLADVLVPYMCELMPKPVPCLSAAHVPAREDGQIMRPEGAGTIDLRSREFLP